MNCAARLIPENRNCIFRPPRDLESFTRRFRGRYNIVQFLARLGERPVGFFLGFELKPTVFFAWFYGVAPEVRRRLDNGRALQEMLYEAAPRYVKALKRAQGAEKSSELRHVESREPAKDL